MSLAAEGTPLPATNTLNHVRMAWRWDPQQDPRGAAFDETLPFSLHEHAIKYFIPLLPSTCFITEQPRFFFLPPLLFIPSGGSDITAVHLGCFKTPRPRRDRAAAIETARLTGAGWTNSARHENDGNGANERRRLSERRRGCCSLLR